MPKHVITGATGARDLRKSGDQGDQTGTSNLTSPSGGPDGGPVGSKNVRNPRGGNSETDAPDLPGAGERSGDVRNPGTVTSDECDNPRTFGDYESPDRPNSSGVIPSHENVLRQLGIGNSAEGEVWTVSYGNVKVPGLLMFAEVVNTTLYCVWTFGFGVISAWNGVTMNKEDITAIDGLITTETREGNVSQAVTSILNLFGHVDTFPGLTLYGATFYIPDSDFGGSLNIEANIDARKCIEFRTAKPAFNTLIYTDNLVLVAYDILTSEWPWTSEIDPADIDLDSWTDLANQCDGIVGGDASRGGRFRYRGTFDNRDAWSAAKEVLRHAHMHVAAVGSKFYLWYEGDITPKTDVISRWFATPECMHAEPGTILTEVNVLYWSFEDNDQRNVFAEIPAAAGAFVQSEVSMNGFREAFMAFRWGMQEIALRNEIWEVHAATGPEAAQLLPGDIVPCLLTNGFGLQNVRILEVPTEIEKGKYQIKGRIYGSTVQNEDNIALDPSGTWIPPWQSGVDNLPSAVNQEFIFSGDWETYTRGGDPDDLSAWTAAGVGFVLDGSGDFSSLSPFSGSGTATLAIDWSDFVIVPTRQLVCFVFRTNSAYVYDSDFTLKVLYYSKTDPAGWDVKWIADITPENDTDHEWKVFVAVIDNTIADEDHRIGFVIDNYGSGPWPDVIDVRSFYWVPWGSNPNLAILERFTYTEDALADITIDQYEVWKAAASGSGSLITAVPQGIDILEGTYISGSGLNTAPAWAVGQFYMRALGLNGRHAPIPIDTQSFGALLNQGDFKSIRDVDETGILKDKIVGVGSNNETKIMKYLNQYGGSPPRTVTGASDTIVDADDVVFFDATSNNILETLPAPGGVFLYRTVRFFRVDSSGFVVDITGTILGGNYKLFSLESLAFYDNGTQWVPGL